MSRLLNAVVGVRVFSMALALLSVATVARSQIPDEFTNLKILDPAIEKSELLETMKGFALGLGVRCAHCHVGPDDLQGMDFATDEKASKQTARRMLGMVRAINGETLVGLPSLEDGERAQEVSCYTCHRGLAEPPAQLVDVLAETARASGAETALERYRELRAEHYGAGRYDFSEETLSRLARKSVEAKAFDDALTILDGASEFYGRSASLVTNMGMVHFARGDLDAARSSFQQAVEIDPDFAPAGRALAQIEAMLSQAASESAVEKP